MLELERLNVRVVSGRAVKDEDYAGDESIGRMQNAPNNADPNLVGRRGSITASLLNAADIARASGGGGEWSVDNGIGNGNGLGGFDASSMQQRRNNNNSQHSNSIMGDLSKKDDVPAHRPLVGGGSAAAYEAARAEHYRELAEKKNKDQSPSNEDGIMSNAMGVMQSGGLGGGMQQGLGGPSINANQHYEMLKLHHMNLLNEIQETTLMMNIYQQQQFQQQQQQQMQQQQIKEQQQQMQQIQNSQHYGGSSQNHMSQMSDQHGSTSSKNSSQSKKKKHARDRSPKAESNDQPATITTNTSSDDGEKSSTREDKLAKIKAEIEERKRMLEELVNGADDSGSGPNKRPKTAV